MNSSSSHNKFFTAYDIRSIDERSGLTTGRLGDIRQDTAHAIGGTAELALKLLYHLSVLRRTQAPLSDDYGPAGGCWSMSVAAAPARAVGSFTGLRAGRSSGCRRRATGAAGPSRDYRPAGSSRRRHRLRRGRCTVRGTTGRTDPPTDYAGVPRGTQTTRPRDFLGAGRRVSPILGVLS